MAICSALEGVTVEVIADGQALHEYEDSDVPDEGCTVNRFIEATTGQSFQLRYSADASFKFKGNAVSFKLRINGQRASGKLLRKTQVDKGDNVYLLEGICTKDGNRRALCFEPISIVDDGTSGDPDKSSMDSKAIGTIEVNVTHRTAIGLKSKRPDHNVDLSVSKRVSEKILKGRSVTHNIELGQILGSASRTSWDTLPVDGADGPAAVFRFHYVSRDALRSRLLLSDAASSETVNSEPALALEDRDITTLSQADIRELQRRARKSQVQFDSKVAIKRERADSAGSSRPQKSRRSDHVTVITLDDEGEIVSEITERRTQSPSPHNSVLIN